MQNLSEHKPGIVKKSYFYFILLVWNITNYKC